MAIPDNRVKKARDRLNLLDIGTPKFFLDQNERRVLYEEVTPNLRDLD
jgi:hypothetical protein